MTRMQEAVLTAVLLVATQVHGAAFVPRHLASTTTFRHTVVTPSAREDFYHEPHFEVAATASSAVSSDTMEVDRIKTCAQQGECTVEEMDRMIADLERRGSETNPALKEALLLQKKLALLQKELDKSVQSDAPKYSFATTDHAFEHYVDYKDMGTYESH